MNEWTKRNQDYTLVDGAGAFSIGFAGMDFCEDDLKEMAPKFAAAAQGMADIEAGKIKNPDENRKVTHFSDRASYVSSTLFETVEAFVEDIHSGALLSPAGKKFKAVVVNGIGGSALGPQRLRRKPELPRQLGRRLFRHQEQPPRHSHRRSEYGHQRRFLLGL